MKTTKWYNWTGDAMWDEYCKVTGLMIILPGTLFLLLVLVGVLTGVVEVTS